MQCVNRPSLCLNYFNIFRHAFLTFIKLVFSLVWALGGMDLVLLYHMRGLLPLGLLDRHRLGFSKGKLKMLTDPKKVNMEETN